MGKRHIRHGLVAAVFLHIGPYPVKADFLCHAGEAFQYHGIVPQPFHAGEVVHKIVLARPYMENIGGAHAVLALHAQRQMGVGAAIGVQVLGFLVVGLAPQLVKPGLGFLKGGKVFNGALLFGVGSPCFQVGNHIEAPFPACLRLGGSPFRQRLFRPFSYILPQRQRIEGGRRGKAHVVKHIVHIGFFQGSRCEVVGPRGGIAHLAVCNIMAQSRFQMGADFSVHGQRHIVPADIAAGLLVGPVVKLHIQQRVGL